MNPNTNNLHVMGRQPRGVLDMRRGGRTAPLVGFSGTAYVAGNKITGLTSDSTKPWVKCDLDAGTASEQSGPPSDPFPENQEWYEKANTYGDIHESRA